MLRLLALGTVLLLAGAGARPGCAQVGFAAGLNFDRFSSMQAGEEEIGFEAASGYHFGLFYDVGPGPLVVRPGLFFHNVREVAFDLSGLPPGSTAPRFGLNLIEVPVDVRLRMEVRRLRMYVLAGPVVRFASSDNDAITERLERRNWAGNVGAGFELGLPGSDLKLFPEVLYTFGVTRALKEVELLSGEDLMLIRTSPQRLSTLMLRFGMAL